MTEHTPDQEPLEVALPRPQETWARIGEQLFRFHDDRWGHLVRTGRIPPNALIISRRWTKGLWRKAESLEVYHLYRPSDYGGHRRAPQVASTKPEIPRRGPLGMFRGPGISLTEVLIAVNVLVAGGLYWLWGDDYSRQLWGNSEVWRQQLFGEGKWGVLFIPLFLHASVTHLASNMFALAGGGAVVEEYYGRKRMLFLYLFAGITGALLSLVREKAVLSVGASGAIMGMFGVFLVFLIRQRPQFTHRQRWRLNRIQIPFFLLLVVPSILHADAWAHLGGFLGGALGALFVPPLSSRIEAPESPSQPTVVQPDTVSPTDRTAISSNADPGPNLG